MQQGSGYAIDDKKRVAAYCRVSTDKEDQANSLESQIRYFTEYIEKNPGMQLAEIYYDNGISGTSIARRAGFNRMISDAEKGCIDLIITREVSRFARNTVDTLQYVRRLKARNIGVIFMSDNISTLDSEGEFRLTIMASISQEESRKTSERVKWGQKRRMEQGVVFGRDLLGYTVRSGRLYINPEEAEIVRLIFHKYTIEEKGAHTIARELSEAGFRPKRAEKWSETVILRALKNEKYVGDLCQKKTCTPDFLTHKKKYNRGDEDMVCLKNHHKPIIDREMWERTQSELMRRSRTDKAKSKYSGRYWCSGKLVCGECGHSFISRRKKLKGGGFYHAWRCYASVSRDKSEPCSNSSVNDRVLLAAVSYCIKLICQEYGSVRDEILSELQSVQNLSRNIDTSNVQGRISVIRDKKQKAIDLALDGIISMDDLRRQNESYDSQLENLSAQLSALEKLNSENQAELADMNEYSAVIDRILEFDSDDTELFHCMIDKIVIFSGNILVVYLKTLPFGIKLWYQSKGRAETFGVHLEQLDII